MSQKYKELKTFLQELFQLDQPDLDFGLYRVLHAKSAEVSQFLDRDLLPQVQEAFAQYKTADKAEIEKELAKAIEQAQGLGVDPETTQKVKDLRARRSGSTSPRSRSSARSRAHGGQNMASSLAAVQPGATRSTRSHPPRSAPSPLSCSAR
jgi:hypothetical protein